LDKGDKIGYKMQMLQTSQIAKRATWANPNFKLLLSGNRIDIRMTFWCFYQRFNCCSSAVRFRKMLAI